MLRKTETTYLALGSNLGDRRSHLSAAIDQLAATPGITVAAVSSFHETAPVGGPPGQGAYLNAALRIGTALPPQELLARCLEIEQAQGRERIERWAARTLDLDLLLYGNRVIQEDGLIIPHPRLRERLFVLCPLSEVAPPSLPLPPDGARLETILRIARQEQEDAR
jgi:2-amino-4-hydroxy-6-hydroxymethyldihydropteridine diphosphokinase